MYSEIERERVCSEEEQNIKKVFSIMTQKEFCSPFVGKKSLLKDEVSLYLR